LLLWHNDRATPIIHAGLVSYSGLGVLFAGQGGVGKSTSALACVAAGFEYVGDDYIALDVKTNGFVAGHSVYNSAWLAPDLLFRFPFLVPFVIKAERKKWPVLLSQAIPKNLSKMAPIRALLLPRVDNLTIARLLPATKREALLALMPSSMMKLPIAGTRGFEKIVQLIEQVPCYWLELGRNLDTVSLRVKQLIGEIKPQNGFHSVDERYRSTDDI
jgi:hypothetical protein